MGSLARATERRHWLIAVPIAIMLLALLAWGYHLIQATAEREAVETAKQVATQTAVQTIEQNATPTSPAWASPARLSWTPECLQRVEWDLHVDRDQGRSYRVILREEPRGREIEPQIVRSSSSTGTAAQGQGTRSPGVYSDRFWELKPILGFKGFLVVTLTYDTPNRNGPPAETVIFMRQALDWRAIPCTPPKAAAEPWGGSQFAMQGPF